MYIKRDGSNVINGISKWPFNDGIPAKDQEQLSKDDSEVTAYLDEQEAGPTNEEVYDATLQNNKLIKALVLSILDGSVKEDVSPQNAKTAILSKM